MAELVNVVTRDQWRAREPRNRTPIGAVRGLALHYSAMNADEQASHSNCAARVRGVQAYHMDHNGWADIAYSHLVCKHGFVFVGRGWGIRTAAQGTNEGNEHYHAVCFLGDDTAGRDDVTLLGREALARLWLNSRLRYLGARELRPHSLFHATSCPGDELRAFAAHLSRALALG